MESRQPWYRRLGGVETAHRCFTLDGYPARDVQMMVDMVQQAWRHKNSAVQDSEARLQAALEEVQLLKDELQEERRRRMKLENDVKLLGRAIWDHYGALCTYLHNTSNSPHIGLRPNRNVHPVARRGTGYQEEPRFRERHTPQNGTGNLLNTQHMWTNLASKPANEEEPIPAQAGEQILHTEDALACSGN